MATYNTEELDNKTKGIITANANAATQDQGAIADESNRGVAQAGQSMLQNDQQAAQESARAGGNSPQMIQAIRNKYNQYAGKDIASIVNMNQINAPARQGNRLAQASQLALAQDRVRASTFAKVANAYIEADAGRDQVLGTIFDTMNAFKGGFGSEKKPKTAAAASAPVDNPQVDNPQGGTSFMGTADDFGGGGGGGGYGSAGGGYGAGGGEYA